MTTIIGQVTRSSDRPALGECVLVEAFAPDGSPLTADSGAEVAINGVRGARQWLQPDHAGSYPVVVTARRDGVTETDVSSLVVQPVAVPDPAAHTPSQPRPDGAVPVMRTLVRSADGPGVPMLHLSAAGEKPYRAVFSVAGPDLDMPVGSPIRATRLGLRPGSLLHGSASLEQAGDTSVAPPRAALTVRRYRWDFGDGTSAVTEQPWAEHDFEAELGPDELHRSFDVTVTYARPDGSEHTMVRTLGVHNAYAICKQRGVVVPRSASSGYATPLLGGFEATMTVSNIEPGPITLTSRRVRLVTWEGGEDLYGPVEDLTEPVVVPGRGSVVVPVVVRHAEVPAGSPGFAVCFAGTTADGLPVRLESQFDVTRADQGSSGLRVGSLAVTHLKAFRELVDSATRALATPADPPVDEAPADRGRLQVGHGTSERVDLTSTPAHSAVRGRFQDGVERLGRAAGGLTHHGDGPSTGGAGGGEAAGLQVVRHVGPAMLAQAGLAQGSVTRLADRTGEVALHVRTDADLGLELRSNVAAATALLSPDTLSTDAHLLRAVSSDLVSTHLFDLVTRGGPPVEGATCDPDNVDAPRGWACQATGKVEEKQVPGRFLNARKGDIILSPGGLGMIGGMLMSVSPPQRYAHCGIMTANHTEITHSTGAGDRVEAYPVGSILGDPQPSDGHRPDVVKYGWPGVVTQSVEDAVNGSWMLDPETKDLPDDQKKWYRIATFSPGRSGMPVQGVWEMVPALVVKPDPMQETPEIRRRLRDIANTARGEAGKSHYRFFAYTDPTIGLTTTAPPEAGWAAGTYPSVCSSFLWLMLRRHGVFLEAGADPATEGSLEPADRSAGAQVSGTSPDGLYLYTAQERVAAGQYLYDYLHNKVIGSAEDEAGVLGDLANLFSDMADDVANQICNTFAFDWSDTEAKDSDRWREEPHDASAVSPDNILLWDGPALTGLYGYAEPLHYRERRIEAVAEHAWHQVTRFATLHGRVLRQGAPIGGILVQLYDGMEAFSAADGTYRLTDVPQGRYRLKAGGRDVGGVLLAAEQDLVLDRDDMTLDISLGGPPEQFRRVTVSGSMHIVDFEDFGSDEITDRPFGRDFFVGPFHTHEDFTFVERWGGEIRVELRVILDWRLDNGVDARWEHRFFEGASEDTDDLDGQADKNFTVAAGWWQSWTTAIDSGGAGSSTISVTFDNQVNPS